MVDEPAQPLEPTSRVGAEQESESLYRRPDNALADWLTSHPTLFRVVIWSVVLGSIITGVSLFAAGRLKAENVGYTGVFLINLIGSASVVVPVPGLAAACAAAAPSAGLNVIILGLLGGTGATIGELTGYMAGYGGQSFVQKVKHYDRVSNLVVRRGAVALFILAVVPNPIFDIAGIAAGSLGYPVRRFLAWVFLGKIIKFIVIAYACQQSIGWLTGLI